MKRLTILGLTATLLLTACGGSGSQVSESSAAPVPTEMAAPVDARESVTFQGDQEAYNTEAFNLKGNYKFDWALTCPEQYGLLNVQLWRVDDSSYYDTDLTGIVEVKKEPSRQGSSNLYNVDDTDYYLKITSMMCEWVITLSPN